MTVDAGSASVYGTKKLKIVTKDPASVPFQIDLQFGWSYRRAITITNTGSALSDFQVSFILDTAALITAGKMLALGQDIRVTDSDETTPLPFWVQSINTTTTKIWVKVPTVPNGNKTIYLYYGNSNTSDAQNGTNTFIFFDDFESYSLSDLNGQGEWSGAASYDVQNSVVKTGSNAVIRMASAGDEISKSITQNKNFIASFFFRLNDVLRVGQIVLKENATQITRAGIDSSKFLDNVGAWGTANANTWYEIDLKVHDDNKHDIAIDGTIVQSARANTNNMVNGVNTFVLSGSTISEFVYYDRILIRQYAATEPSTAVGAETNPSTGIGSSTQTILKVAESSGNIGIRNTSPTNILTIQQNSLTDPIADSWTVWPCDRTTKIILRELTGPEALPELAKIRLYEWKKKPRRDDITMPKFQAARIGMMIDDAEVPARILSYDMNGNLQGIDLLAYIGFLHVAMKELNKKVALLEAKPP